MSIGFLPVRRSMYLETAERMMEDDAQIIPGRIFQDILHVDIQKSFGEPDLVTHGMFGGDFLPERVNIIRYETSHVGNNRFLYIDPSFVIQHADPGHDKGF